MKGLFKDFSASTFIAVIAFVYIDKFLNITDSMLKATRRDETTAAVTES